MNITFTNSELALIGKALSLMPYGEVFNLVANLQKQIIDAQKEQPVEE